MTARREKGANSSMPVARVLVDPKKEEEEKRKRKHDRWNLKIGQHTERETEKQRRWPFTPAGMIRLEKSYGELEWKARARITRCVEGATREKGKGKGISKK